MHPRIASACFYAVLVGLLCTATDADDKSPGPPAADQNAQQVRKTRPSEKAVVNDIVYGLEEEDNSLYLTSQPLNGVDRQRLRVELDFEIPKEDRATELSLASMGAKHLMAVVKLKHEDEYEFYCLTILAPGGGDVRDRFKVHGTQLFVHRAKFFTTRDDFRILAISGKHYLGTVFVVLGDMFPGKKNNDFNLTTKGAFYFSGCPWPPSGGSLTPFQVEQIPPKVEMD